MEEKQVTVAGITYKLPKLFVVMVTTLISEHARMNERTNDEIIDIILEQVPRP